MVPLADVVFIDSDSEHDDSHPALSVNGTQVFDDDDELLEVEPIMWIDCSFVATDPARHATPRREAWLDVVNVDLCCVI